MCRGKTFVSVYTDSFGHSIHCFQCCKVILLNLQKSIGKPSNTFSDILLAPVIMVLFTQRAVIQLNVLDFHMQIEEEIWMTESPPQDTSSS